MKKIIVSAPGKLHLSGEHAVVYGKPALITAVTLRLYVNLENQKSKIKNQKLIRSLKRKDSYINVIIKNVEKNIGKNFDKLYLEINSQIPSGAGMGSSAALAVALTGALLSWVGEKWNPEKINKLAYESEKFMHKNSSGSDPTIATFGGLLWYRKELEFLKSFWLLTFKYPKNFPKAYIVQTGRSETTGDLVQMVGRNLKTQPQKTEKIFNQIEKVTKNMTVAIHDKNLADFLEAVKNNQILLEDLGIVSERVKKFIKQLRLVGGIAKISGAGGLKSGSGALICFHKQSEIIKELAKKFKYSVLPVSLGGEGVKIEQITI